MINEEIIKRKCYCCEDLSLIENYNEAVNSPEEYVIHHRLEIQGDKLLSRKELKEMNMYFNRPASELIFMTYSEHSRIHMQVTRNKIYTTLKDDTKNKLSNLAKKNGLGLIKTPKQLNKIWTKYKWLTPSGEIKVMHKQHALRYHPDWKLIE